MKTTLATTAALLGIPFYLGMYLVAAGIYLTPVIAGAWLVRTLFL